MTWDNAGRQKLYSDIWIGADIASALTVYHLPHISQFQHGIYDTQNAIENLNNHMSEFWTGTSNRQELYLHAYDSDMRSHENLLNSARGYGVDRHFQGESTLAIYGGDDARPHLQYFASNSSGGIEYRSYSDLQFDQLQHNARPQIGTDVLHYSIEGHHAISVRNPLLSERESIFNASNPDGIIGTDREAHKFLHGGNYQHPTYAHVNTLTMQQEQTLSDKEHHIDSYQNGIDSITLETVFLTGTISGAVALFSGLNDTRQWIRQAAAKNTLITFGTSSVSGLITHEVLLASHPFWEHTVSNISSAVSDQSVIAISDMSLSTITEIVDITEARLIITSIVTAGKLLSGESIDTIALSRSVGKQIGIQSACSIADQLIAVATNSAIPEPHTAAIVASIRIALAAHKFITDQAFQKKLISIQMDLKHDYALKEC